MLAVIINGSVAGELHRLADNRLRLRYHEDYRTNPTATPLSVSMPVELEEHSDQRVSPWLWGLLPDNADVLARWGRDFGVSIANPFPLLGTKVGYDCPGAVQFCPAEAVDDLLGRGGDVSEMSEADVAARLRALKADATTWLGPARTGQFSLGGAQAKTALHFSALGWGEPSGNVPTTHILKPTVPDFDWLDVNEHLCLVAAANSGLRAARTQMGVFEDQTAIIVERFDRVAHQGTLTRVHHEDLCQALSLHPTRKYQADGGPSPGQIAVLLRSAVTGGGAADDLWGFFDALAFNWLIAGSDAHAKNYSLLLAGTQSRLAPLYDVASFLPYDKSKGHKISLAMKIGGDYRLRRTDRPGAWDKTADEMGLDRDTAITRILNLARKLPTAFDQAAHDNTIQALPTDLPRRLVDQVATRAQHCIELLS